MDWRTKRAIVTAAIASVPYLAWTFVSLDPFAAFATAEARLGWLVFTVFAGGMTFTYQGWRH